MRLLSTHGQRLVGALVLLALLCAPVPAARAKVRVCVSFHGPALKNPRGYHQLLVSELAHHPTHQVVHKSCATTLRLEYIKLDRGGFLTAQLHGAVPHRVRVKRLSELPARMREVVAFVLKREPVYLVNNLASSGLLAPPRLSLLKHGIYLLGLELSEVILWTPGAFTALPSAALRFRRAVDRWFVGARVSIAYNPLPRPAEPLTHFVRYHGSARAEVGVTLFPHGPVALLLSGLVGIEYLQVYKLLNGQRRDNILALFGVSLRVGVELFRLYTVRMNLFAQLNLPLHKARNLDLPVIDAYTPSLALGAGVSF